MKRVVKSATRYKTGESHGKVAVIKIHFTLWHDEIKNKWKIVLRQGRTGQKEERFTFSYASLTSAQTRFDQLIAEYELKGYLPDSVVFN